MLVINLAVGYHCFLPVPNPQLPSIFSA